MAPSCFEETHGSRTHLYNISLQQRRSACEDVNSPLERSRGIVMKYFRSAVCFFFLSPDFPPPPPSSSWFLVHLNLCSRRRLSGWEEKKNESHCWKLSLAAQVCVCVNTCPASLPSSPSLSAHVHNGASQMFPWRWIPADEGRVGGGGGGGGSSQNYYPGKQSTFSARRV